MTPPRASESPYLDLGSAELAGEGPAAGLPVPAPSSGLSARILARLPSADRLTIAVVLVVVVLVSIPLLRRVALRQNELDAMRSLVLLDRAAESGPPGASLAELFAADPALVRVLPDAELLPGGEALRRHGYLVELVRDPAGGRRLVAWPWSHGRTGLGAFALAGDGSLRGHPNREARWSGPGRSPNDLIGWRALRIAR